MIADDHTCAVPVTGRKFWWTCEICGQLWRKVDGRWKLTPREEIGAAHA